MASFLDVLFPPLCLNCGKNYRVKLGLCSQCLVELESTGLNGCIRCGRICRGQNCAPLAHRYSRVLSLAQYTGPWRKVVQNVKFARDRQVAQELARELAGLAAAAGFALPGAVVPVPGAAKHWRSYNLVNLLCHELAQSSGAPVAKVLARRPGRAPQVQLSRHQRLEGLENYIYLCNQIDLKGALIWLVDDVYTTGATADACAAALLAAGARSVYVLVLAA